MMLNEGMETPTATVGAHGVDPTRRDGSFFVMTKLGAQVMRHDHLDAAAYDAVLADPTTAHRTTWAHRLAHRPRKDLR